MGGFLHWLECSSGGSRGRKTFLNPSPTPITLYPILPLPIKHLWIRHCISVSSDSSTEMTFETLFHLYYSQGYFVIREIQKKEFPLSCFDGDMNLTFRSCLLVRLASIMFCFAVEVANNIWHSHRKNWPENIGNLIANLDIILFVPLGLLTLKFKSHWIKRKNHLFLRCSKGSLRFHSLHTILSQLAYTPM